MVWLARRFGRDLSNTTAASDADRCYRLPDAATYSIAYRPHFRYDAGIWSCEALYSITNIRMKQGATVEKMTAASTICGRISRPLNYTDGYGVYRAVQGMHIFGVLVLRRRYVLFLFINVW